jgi:hypothetical protein
MIKFDMLGNWKDKEDKEDKGMNLYQQSTIS